jgi:hypothetical protein
MKSASHFKRTTAKAPMAAEIKAARKHPGKARPKGKRMSRVDLLRRHKLSTAQENPA